MNRTLYKSRATPTDPSPRVSTNHDGKSPGDVVLCRFALVALVALFCVFATTLAQADGGIVRIRETQGPFTITVFSPASVIARVPTDLTVMVQNSKTGEVVMDALVDVSVSAPAGAKLQPGDPFCSTPGSMPFLATESAGSPPTFRATRAHASNKLLYGLPMILNAPGSWRLRATVRKDGDSAMVTCALPVETTSPRLSGLWLYLAVPPCFVALFISNQWLRAAGVRPSPGAATPKSLPSCGNS